MYIIIIIIIIIIKIWLGEISGRAQSLARNGQPSIIMVTTLHRA